MIYHWTGETSKRSFFKRKFNLETRKEKRRGMVKHAKGTNYCFLVIEYASSMHHYCDYEL
jgi:hypothetical protein